MVSIKYVKISSINDVIDFVKHASEVKGDVLVKRGKYIVDGSSTMGVFSIDCSQGCSVEYPSNEVEFDEFLNKFVV